MKIEDITDEMFDNKLLEILEELPMVAILRIEGVYEAVSEHFNNAVIDELVEEEE